MIKIIKYIILPLAILSSLWNAYFSIISFVATNLTIRESFYFINDVTQKGTHWGGDSYARDHSSEFAKSFMKRHLIKY